MVHCDAVGGARREAPPRPPRGQQNSPAVQVIAGLFLSGFLDRSFAIMNIKQEV